MKTVTRTKARFHLTQQARRRVALTTLICLAFGDAYALPFGEQVQAGNVAFDRGVQFLNINQASQKAIVNWQSFSIAANEAVRLNQPTQGVALFRVLGSDPSQIFGSLTATGSLFLSNPNGVLFGRSAQVDVGSLVATSMRIGNDDFLAGRYQFNADENASVVNDGIIRAEDGGYIALLGNTVENNGSLQANNGSVVLGSAQSAILDMYGDGLVRVKLDGDALRAVIKQTGNITADGGAVQLATNARSAAINVHGVVQANSLVERNGVIRLEGGQNAKVSVNGNLSATGNLAGSKGGTIEVTGEQVALFNNAHLDASGDAGGGTVLVGGDLQGKNAQVYNARTTYVAQGAQIDVSAKQNGNGGKAIIWADSATRYYGSILAKGGADSGNGGFAEVSGKQYLDFLGRADLSATNGLSGNLLLDPLNITLTTVDANTTGFTPPGDITQAFTDDAGLTSTFNVNAGGSFAGIAAGSTITLQATNNITIANTFNVATATGSANNSLVLQANNNIAVNAAVTTSGTGSITMQADADNIGGGNLAIGANIISQSGGITLSGANITRSAGNIASTGAAGANSGNIKMSATGAITLGAATISANSVTAATAGNAGNINISAGTGFTGTGAINTTGGNSTGASTVGGSGGSVSIVSTTGAIGTGTITTSGGAAGAGIANGNNAGNVTVTASAGNATVGAITARTGSATGTGASGGVANVNVSGAAVTLAAVNTSGQNNGNGGTISANASGELTLNGGITSAGGASITGNAGKNAGLINLTGASINSATAGTITASGSNGLGANQAGGNGAAVNINATGAISVRAITANGGNGVATNAKGGDAGSITISTNNGNISTNAGALNARTGVGIGTGANAIPGLIAINNTSATGTITTGSISTAGNTNGNGGNISVTGNGDVNIAGTVSSSGSASTGTRAGRNAGNITITGANVNAGAITASGGAGIGTNQNGGTGGAVSLTAGTGNTITHTSITTSGGARTGTGLGGNGGNISINGNSLLAADTTITSTVGTGGVSSGTVNFVGAINSSGANRTLTINTTAATTLSGAIGNTLALTSLTTNAGGNTAINGGSVTTTGAQTYNDAASTSGNTTFTTTNSNVTFANSIVATGNTVISAGTGTVTATNAANNFGNLAITAGTANIRDTNAIVLGATNVLGNYTLQSGGAVTQSAAVTVGGATSITAGAANDVTLNNAANNFNSIGIVSGRDVNLVDANALTVNASTVRTMTAQTLSGDFTLGGAITASGTGSGSSVRLAAAQSFINAGNFGISPGALSRWLVYSTNPTADTRGAGLITASNFKQYNTTFPGSISGTGNGFVYSIAPTITASLSGAATKTYDGTITAPIGGLTLGQSGAIDGDTVNLSALTSATYNDKNAGTGKTVTSNALSITGATNGGKQVFGYTLAGPTASGNVGTINQRAITVSAATDTKTYDGNTTSLGAPTVTSGSIVVGDTGSFSQTFDNRNAGTGKTLTAAGSVSDGNGGNNYAVTFAADNTGIINQRAITVSAATDTKTYDGNTTSLGAPTVTSGSIVVGDTGSFSQTFDNRNAGTGKTLTAAGSVSDGNGGNNYAVTFAADNMGIINQRAITVSAVTDTKTYDGNTTSLGAPTVTSGSIVVGDTGSFSQTFDNRNAGTGKTLTAAGSVSDGNGGNNYAVTFAADNTGIINQRAITVSAATDTKTYDGNTTSLGAPTVTSGSIVVGDTGSFSQTFDNRNAGTGKTLTAAGSVSDGNGGNNYAVTFAADNMGIINQRAITVTANPGQGKVFGAADPLLFTFTVGGLGLVGGDTLTGSLNRVAGETVGGYAINQGNLAASSNYVLSYVGSIFNIFAPPSSTSGANPRNAAGLVDLNPSLANYTNPQLFVLNVGATAAGADSEGSTACEQDPESLAKDKDFVLMLNYGLNLPKGLNTSCDTTKI